MTPPSTTYRRLLALAGCAAVLAAAGCGSDKEEEDPGAPIPTAQAQALQERLGEIQRRFDFGDGACADIQNDSKPAVEQVLQSIPAKVRADVRSALDDSFNHLFQLSDEQCDEQKGQETTTTETPTETEPPPTVTTETETQPTTPTETTPPQTQTTPPPTATTPPAAGNGQGNNGNGNGNGGPSGSQGGGVSPEDQE